MATGPAPLRDSAGDRILKSLAMVTRIVHLVQQQQECCEDRAAVCRSETQNCRSFLTLQNTALAVQHGPSDFTCNRPRCTYAYNFSVVCKGWNSNSSMTEGLKCNWIPAHTVESCHRIYSNNSCTIIRCNIIQTCGRPPTFSGPLRLASIR
jgi:hypothetical protein